MTWLLAPRSRYEGGNVSLLTQRLPDSLNPVVPFQAVSQIIDGNLQMDNAARLWQCATGRRMNDERAHQDCAALGNGTGNAWLLSPSCDFIGSEASGSVRAWDHAERSVAGVAFVKVQADGEHVPHYGCWRLDMRGASFDRPWAEMWRILSFTNRYRAILVPGDLPVRVGRFVEKEPPHGKAIAAENVGDKLSDWFGNCQIAHCANFQ
jgi:hypothetical protein